MTKTTNALGIVSLVISVTAFFCFFMAEKMALNHTEKIITALILFVFGYLAAFFGYSGSAEWKKEKRRMKLAFTFFFFLYIVIFIDFTLIDGTFGRNISNIFSLNSVEIKEYIRENTNFVPFKTVKIFISAYKDETLSIGAIIENILGNFFVLTPFALFAPCAFPKMRKPLNFFAFCSVAVIAVEVLQLVFLTGSTDIDDFLLNVSGGMAGFVLLNIPPVKRAISHLTFGLFRMDKNEIKSKCKN